MHRREAFQLPGKNSFPGGPSFQSILEQSWLSGVYTEQDWGKIPSPAVVFQQRGGGGGGGGGTVPPSS